MPCVHAHALYAWHGKSQPICTGTVPPKPRCVDTATRTASTTLAISMHEVQTRTATNISLSFLGAKAPALAAVVLRPCLRHHKNAASSATDVSTSSITTVTPTVKPIFCSTVPILEAPAGPASLPGHDLCLQRLMPSADELGGRKHQTADASTGRHCWAAMVSVNGKYLTGVADPSFWVCSPLFLPLQPSWAGHQATSLRTQLCSQYMHTPGCGSMY